MLCFFFSGHRGGRAKVWASSKMSSDKVHDVFIKININYYLNRNDCRSQRHLEIGGFL